MKALNQKGALHLAALLIVAVGVGVVGSYIIVNSKANPAPKGGSGAAVITLPAEGVFLGDWYKVKVSNVSNTIMQKGMRFEGDCFTDGTKKGSLLGFYNSRVDSGGVINMQPSEINKSEYGFSTAGAQCNATLSYEDRKGTKELGKISFAMKPHRVTFTTSQAQPISKDAKFTFTIGTLPTGVDKANLGIQTYCDFLVTTPNSTPAYDYLDYATGISIDGSNNVTVPLYSRTDNVPARASGEYTCFAKLLEANYPVPVGTGSRTLGVATFKVQF